MILKRIPKEGYAGLEPIAAWLRRGEACITNLETVLTELDCFPSAFSGGTWLSARPAVLQDLLRYGVNLISLANNHTLDYGYEGLYSTIRAMRAANAAYAGVGMNLYEANRPAVLELPSGRTGLIAVSASFENAARAGVQGPDLPGRPGLNFLRHDTTYRVPQAELSALQRIADEAYINGTQNLMIKDGFTPAPPAGSANFGSLRFRVGDTYGKETVPHADDLHRITDTVRDARCRMDYVVVMAHSHDIAADVFTQPDAYFETFCRACIDAGATAVIGSGTHQLNPIEIYRGKPIFYSLGDFIFQCAFVETLPPDFKAQYGLPPEATTAEALAKRSQNNTRGLGADPLNFQTVVPYFEAAGDVVDNIKLLPVELGFSDDTADRGLPRIATGNTAKEIFERLQAISAPYGTRMRFDSGLIIVEGKDSV